jgi:hypothetical protein
MKAFNATVVLICAAIYYSSLALVVWTGMSLSMFNQALACACCTDEGERFVEVENMNLALRERIDQLRFGKAAKLFVGEVGLEAIKGIANPSEHYNVEVTRDRGHLIFLLRDEAKRTGTLTLHIPSSVSMFEVDPRDGQQDGAGVRLYKEWKLSSKMDGTGIFATGNGNQQFLTLILQGRGNHCSNFTHWTLVVNGPVANYLLFGSLSPRD